MEREQQQITIDTHPSEGSIKTSRYPVLTAAQEPIIFQAYEKEREAQKKVEAALLNRLTPQQRDAASLLIKLDGKGQRTPRENIAKKLHITEDNLNTIEAEAIARLTDSDHAKQTSERPKEERKHLSPLQILFQDAKKAASQGEDSALQDLRNSEEFLALASPQDKSRFEEALHKVTSVRELIVSCNEGLVYYTAHRFKRHNLTFEDRAMEGHVGLHNAIEKFDYKSGYKFSTYATWWIKQTISREVHATERIIHLPIHISESLPTAGKKAEQFKETHGRLPTEEELSKMLVSPSLKECDAKTVTHLVLNEAKGITSLQIQSSESEREIIEFIPDKEMNTEDQALLSVSRQNLTTALDKAFSEFSERDKEIMYKFYTQSASAAELAKSYGITSERVYQITRSSKKKLQQNQDLIDIWQADI